MPTNDSPSAKSSVIVTFPINIFQLSVKYRRTWNTDRCESVGMDDGDSALYKKDDVCIAYLPSCKHLNDKLSIAQNNNNSA
jgi:hypothetical protein